MPVRNGGAYLSLALDSVLAQTFCDFELLVIDDGSTDGSRQHVEARAAREQRIRLLDNPGRGLVAALNHGILAASGEFIARMDADDISYPDRFERQVAYLRAHPQVAAVGTQARIVDARGNPTGGYSNFPCAPVDVADALIKRGCAIKHPSVLMRRDMIIEVGLYRPAVEHAEDFDLWLRLAELHLVANLPEVLLDYRQHTGQVSHDGNLEQKFAHGVALLSARRRRAGEEDPLNDGEGLNASPSWARQRGTTADEDLDQFARAYRALKALHETDEPQPQGDIEAIFHVISRGPLGGSKRFRVAALMRVARASLANACWATAASAFLMALRIAPGRVMGDMARTFVSGRTGREVHT
jgi:hypothetical protein